MQSRMTTSPVLSSSQPDITVNPDVHVDPNDVADLAQNVNYPEANQVIFGPILNHTPKVCATSQDVAANEAASNTQIINLLLTLQQEVTKLCNTYRSHIGFMGSLQLKLTFQRRVIIPVSPISGSSLYKSFLMS